MIVESVIVGPIHTNCYLATHDGQTLIIDPGADASKIISKITELKLKPAAVINTHGHWDHIMADNEIKKHYGIPLYIPAGDRDLVAGQEEHYHIGKITPDLWYEDTLPLDLPLKLIHTPGHTPGSTCILWENNLFTGDMMFAGGYLGRTDFPYGSADALQKSLPKLLALDDSVIVYPGHDGSTIIGQERGFYAGK